MVHVVVTLVDEKCFEGSGVGKFGKDVGGVKFVCVGKFKFFKVLEGIGFDGNLVGVVGKHEGGDVGTFVEVVEDVLDWAFDIGEEDV